MAEIIVEDIAVVMTVNGVKELSTIRASNIKSSNELIQIDSGFGIKDKDNIYILK